jgi:hypothetical protein
LPRAERAPAIRSRSSARPGYAFYDFDACALVSATLGLRQEHVVLSMQPSATKAFMFNGLPNHYAGKLGGDPRSNLRRQAEPRRSALK